MSDTSDMPTREEVGFLFGTHTGLFATAADRERMIARILALFADRFAKVTARAEAAEQALATVEAERRRLATLVETQAPLIDARNRMSEELADLRLELATARAEGVREGMEKAAGIAKSVNLFDGDFLKNSDPRVTVEAAIRAALPE